jgi:glutaredoxin 3
MSKIEIYTRPGCGYCTHAKRLLTNKGLEFVEYDVYQHPENIKQLHARTAYRTYPQIFIEDVSIGGFTELLATELLAKEQHGLLVKQNHT